MLLGSIFLVRLFYDADLCPFVSFVFLMDKKCIFKGSASFKMFTGQLNNKTINMSNSTKTFLIDYDVA